MRKDDDSLANIMQDAMLSHKDIAYKKNSSITRVSDTFLNEFQMLRHEIPQFGNTWDRFVVRMRSHAQALDFDAEAPKDPIEQFNIITVRGIQLAESVICDVCPKLKAAHREDLVGTFMKNVPPWLEKTYTLDGHAVPVLELLTEAGKAGKRHPMDYGTFEFITTILLDQVEAELQDMRWSSTRESMKSLFILANGRYESLRDELKIAPNSKVEAIKALFVQMSEYVAQTLLDPYDQNHEDVKAIIDKINHLFDYKNCEAGLLFLDKLFPKSNALSDFRYGDLDKILTIKNFGELSGDPWYHQFTNPLIEIISSTWEHRILLTSQLDKHLQNISAKPYINYSGLRAVVPDFEKETHIMAIAFENKQDVIQTFFPDANSCKVFMERRGSIITVYVSISKQPSDDTVKINEIDWLARTNFRYTIDLSSENPEVFLQVFDQENVTAQHKARLVEFTTAAILNRGNRITTPQDEENFRQATNNVITHRIKSKGPERTPGSGRKRRHQNGPKALALPVEIDEPTETAQSVHRSEFCLSDEATKAIQVAHGYTDSQMSLFQKKVDTYNEGGGITKSLIMGSGPNGGTIIALKTAKYRILAELEDGKAIVYDIIHRRDLPRVL